MNDELSQLDELIESDVLDALGVQSPAEEEDTSAEEVDNIIIEDFEEIKEKPKLEEEIQDDGEDEELLEKEWEEELDSKQPEEIPPKVVNNIDMNNTDLASLLGQLLNNKTIEITIKIKD